MRLASDCAQLEFGLSRSPNVFYTNDIFLIRLARELHFKHPLDPLASLAQVVNLLWDRLDLLLLAALTGFSGASSHPLMLLF